MKSRLQKKICAEIAASGGAIPFRRFMEKCLYDSDDGFYADAATRLGRDGHFFTSVHVGAVFGELLARYLFEKWNCLGCPRQFDIVEQGANDGMLAADILGWARAEEPDFFQAVSYHIVEPFDPLRETQKQRLCAAGLGASTQWHESLDALADEFVEGVFFSNELVDAFPIDLAQFKGGTWREANVVWNEVRFVMEVGAAVSPLLLDAIARWRVPAIEGYMAEIHLAAEDWMRQVARVLRRGLVLTLDYGWMAHEFYRVERPQGTLAAYYEHQRTADLYARVGEQDLTAHVNFSALSDVGEQFGLRVVQWGDQHRFLSGIAARQLQSGGTLWRDPARMQAWVRAFQSLSHPQLMGACFKVLEQSKGAI